MSAETVLPAAQLSDLCGLRAPIIQLVLKQIGVGWLALAVAASEGHTGDSGGMGGFSDGLHSINSSQLINSGRAIR
jgi:hypothetical protein